MASQHQYVVCVFAGSNKVVSTSGGDSSDIDGVAVIVEDLEDVVISLAGSDWKLAHQVGENFACVRVPDVNVASVR
jgi:hypothetical protein